MAFLTGPHWIVLIVPENIPGVNPLDYKMTDYFDLTDEEEQEQHEADLAYENEHFQPVPALEPEIALTTALVVAAAGFQVFPVGPNKRPMVSEWQKKATCYPEQIKQWHEQFPGAGTAISHYRIIVIDDDRPGMDAMADFNVSGEMIVDTPSGNTHRVYRLSESDAANGFKRSTNGLWLPKVDILTGEGSYSIVSGHANYENSEGRKITGYWQIRDGTFRQKSDLPELPRVLLDTFKTLFNRKPIPSNGRAQVNGAKLSFDALPEMLKHIDPDCDRERWRNVLMGLKDEWGEKARAIAEDWSIGKLHNKTCEKFDPSHWEKDWDAIGPAGDDGIKLGTAIKYAEEESDGAWSLKYVLGGVTGERGDEVIMKPIDWIDYGVLAKGKLTWASGNADMGKSTACLDYIAKRTRGLPSPWQEPGEQLPPGKWLCLCSEDDRADTIKPRLVLHGADMSKIRFIDFQRILPGGKRQTINVATDMDLLESFVEDGVEGILIEPMKGFIGKTNDNTDNELRDALQPLVDFIVRHKMACLGIVHNNKMSGQSAMHRMAGSQAWGAICRVQMVFGKVPKSMQESEAWPNCVAIGKSNNAMKGKTIAYRIVNDESLVIDGVPQKIGRFVWGPVLDLKADDIVDELDKKQTLKGPAKYQKCMLEILALLEANRENDKATCSMELLAIKAAYGKNAYQRAMKELKDAEAMDKKGHTSDATFRPGIGFNALWRELKALCESSPLAKDENGVSLPIDSV